MGLIRFATQGLASVLGQRFVNKVYLMLDRYLEPR
jgi:hypothetical protein